MTLRLRRGAAIAAKVVDSDGAPVAQAIMLGRSYGPYDENRIPFSPFNGGARTLQVRDGRVDIPGLDPEKPSTFYVLDRKNQLGATVDLTGKSSAGGPVTIRLLPCGSAAVRYKDSNGKAVAGHNPDQLELIITPGSPLRDGR